MSDKDNNNQENNSTNKTNQPDESRRDFLKKTGLVVGGVAGGSLLGGIFTNQYLTGSDDDTKSSEGDAGVDRQRARVFFSRYEDFAVLVAATELIFPEDDNGPGAIGLDVPFFIDKQLAGTWGVNDDDYRQGPFPEKKVKEAPDTTNHSAANRGQIFLDGLRTMNKESQKRFDVTFDEASEEQQGEIMTDLENGELNMRTVPSHGFFDLLKEATLQGAYSDPLYGGNKNMDGWRMKEFAGARASYADVIEEEDFVELEPVSLTDYQRNS